MKITSELLKKYAENKCTREENDVIEKWLNTSKIDIEDIEIKKNKFQEEKLWKNIKKSIPSELEKEQQLKIIPKNKFLWIAASVAIFISLFTYQIFLRNDFTSYKTLAGEVKKILLEDGTKVFLNAKSELKIPKQFSKTERRVTLHGEGYFEVFKDSLLPFIIKTEKYQTKVLGTKFNLFAYTNENIVLTLNEGKVLFTDTKNSLEKGITLLPNEQIVVEKGMMKKRKAIPKHYNSWIHNKLYFNNEPFIAIANKIERIYNVTIKIQKEKLKEETYRGMYNNPSLETLLDDLSFVLKFNYKIEGKKVTIF